MEGSGWGLLHPAHILKHTTGDYLKCRTSAKATEELAMMSCHDYALTSSRKLNFITKFPRKNVVVQAEPQAVRGTFSGPTQEGT
jgi:hypothetical protein